MLVDFNAKLYGTDRKEATVGELCPFCRQTHPASGRSLTLKEVAVTSLLLSGKEQTAEDKKKRYDLLKKIDGQGEGKVNLESQDQTFLKDAIGQSPFNALVAGQCGDWLEGRRPHFAPEPEPQPEPVGKKDAEEGKAKTSKRKAAAEAA